jgi:hypothetical protein
MIYLIGVEHKVQWRQPKAYACPTRQANWALYLSTLEETIAAFRPDTVAEELNQELLNQHNGAKSLLLCKKEEIEARTGTTIKHVFAEPDSAEKSAKGYKCEETIEAILAARMHSKPSREQIMAHMIAHQHPIRERIWFERIRGHLSGEILFICGDIHLYTFRRFLREKKIHCRIARRRIGVDSSCLSEYEGLKLAIKNDMCSDAHCFCLEPISDTRVG